MKANDQRCGAGFLLGVALAALCGCNHQSTSTNESGANAMSTPSLSATNASEMKTNLNEMAGGMKEMATNATSTMHGAMTNMMSEMKTNTNQIMTNMGGMTK
ncbi:MAG TPA: hypothetical protein VMA35_10795 [Candidatus Sulfopaludibacter sp.]|nr:hypothetical protein [Candidatus Sulfopaludibacter sp.]